MSKRTLDGEELLLPVTANWNHSVPPPPSPITLLHLPGQWPAETQQSTAPVSFFTTLGSFAATVSIKNILCLPYYLARRFLRPQRILAQPVIREDGARKKRLIDLGPADPAPIKPRAKFTRRILLSGERLHKPATPTLSIPGQWPESLSPQQPTSDNIWMSIAAHGSAAPSNNIWMDAAVAGPSTPVVSAPTGIRDRLEDPATQSPCARAALHRTARVDETPPSIRAIFKRRENTSTPLRLLRAEREATAATEAADAAAFHATTFDDEFGSPACASTPYGFRAAWSTKTSPIKLSSPPSRKVLTPVSKMKAANADPAPLYSPLVNKHLELGDTPASGRHTRLSRAYQCAPLKRSMKNSVAHQLAVAKVAENARKASAEYKAAYDARANRNAELRLQEDAAKAEKADASFSYANDLSNLSDASPYANDLSTLPDAPPPPPKKLVTFPAHVRAKPFYRDSKVADMLDSYLEDIKACGDPAQARARLQQQDSSGDDDDDNSLPLPQGSPTPSDDGGTVGYQGVPPETFFGSDDSVEESMMSNELVTNLYDDVEKKLLISPEQLPSPVVTTKPLIAELTESELETLEAAVKKTDNGNDPTADVVEGKLKAHDFGTLLPNMFNGDERAWLNDNIVNEYLSILVEHKKKMEGYERKRNGPAPPVHAFLSQWYSNMKKSKALVERWAGRQNLGGKKFLDAKLVLFPICDNSHWRLLAINPKERLIEYYDSLGGVGREYTNVALKYLEMELGPHYIASEWRVSTEQKSMHQKNTSDCGIFTVLNALVLLRGEEHKRVVVSAGMEAARRRLAVTLMAGKPTTEMD